MHKFMMEIRLNDVLGIDEKLFTLYFISLH